MTLSPFAAALDQATAAGITTFVQAAFLRSLRDSRSDRKLTITVLAEKLQISKQAAWGRVDQLINLGLARRIKQHGVGKVDVVLTDKGKSLCDALFPRPEA